MFWCWIVIYWHRQSEDNYEEFFKHKHLSDFSNFPKELKFYDSQNEMVVGKMKVVKFVGLKSKMYSMLSDDGKESNLTKGVHIAIWV